MTPIENQASDAALNSNATKYSISAERSHIIKMLLLAVFGVFTHWNVWESGVYSMGWNTSVFWLLLMVLLSVKNEAIKMRRDWVWVVPLMLISVSFSLYENPWLKVISFLTLPLMVGMFYTFGHISENARQAWTSSLLRRLFKGAMSCVLFLPAALGVVVDTAFRAAQVSEDSVTQRVFKAVLILIPLLLVILVLLSSADERFGQLLDSWFGHLFEILDWTLISKAIWVLIISSVILAATTSLRRSVHHELENQQRSVDGLVAAIVLGCVFIFYLVFLSVQFEFLLVNRLPTEFESTERLVKSGFWQLFFLSGINVGLFYWVYKNTGVVAQWILRAYLLASALILLSACWRMGLYVYFYGLSYEKFFASYTAFYALVLFSFLGWAMFSTVRKDIIKFAVFCSLWMFSVATVLPVERIIFSSNMALSKQVDTRVDLRHLSYLSADVLSQANAQLADGLNTGYWQQWLASNQTNYCDRAWYETNLSLTLNCGALD